MASKSKIHLKKLSWHKPDIQAAGSWDLSALKILEVLKNPYTEDKKYKFSEVPLEWEKNRNILFFLISIKHVPDLVRSRSFKMDDQDL